MAHIAASFMIITDKRSSAATCWTDDQPLFLQEYQRLCVEWERQRIQLQKQVAALEVQNKRLNDELTLSRVRAEFLHPAMTATHTPTTGHKWTLCKFFYFFYFFCRRPLALQAQWESLNQEQREHRGSYAEVQRLRAQLEAAQGRVNSQELEVERLRALESRLGWNQREQQVSAEKHQKEKRTATCVIVKYVNK